MYRSERALLGAAHPDDLLRNLLILLYSFMYQLSRRLTYNYRGANIKRF